MPGPDVTLKIPRPLYERLSHVIEGTGFRSVTEFAVYVLRDLVATQEAVSSGTMSSDEVDAVRGRLRSLGYLGE
jgi:hypothetical protein